ncbi:MAG: poly-beta-1,6-N-acetyl-D-glucosamine biosynthesis protein PgaD [Methylococcales bacterium]|nr:poly-beta-1,6-N-acetyl-D-glucosamine biosynthesis protein PgaD [Methylococcales bacterium]
MNNLIIERPESQSFRQKYTSLFLTCVFWFLWCYIWTPLLVVAFGFMKIDIAIIDSFSFVTFERFLLNLQQYALYIFILCTMFVLWVAMNIFRFRGGNRYKSHPPTEIKELSRYAKLTEDLLLNSKQTQILTARFDQNSQLINLQPLTSNPI